MYQMSADIGGHLSYLAKIQFHTTDFKRGGDFWLGRDIPGMSIFLHAIRTA